MWRFKSCRLGVILPRTRRIPTEDSNGASLIVFSTNPSKTKSTIFSLTEQPKIIFGRPHRIGPLHVV
jgi:hypothetical protein